MAPLWYLVKTNKLGYLEFLERYRNGYDDLSIPLFVYCLGLEHEPIVNGKHILEHLPSDNRGNVYRFIYWIFTGKEANVIINIELLEKISYLCFNFLLSFKPESYQINLSESNKFLLMIMKAGFRLSFTSLLNVEKVHNIYVIFLDIKQWMVTGLIPKWFHNSQNADHILENSIHPKNLNKLLWKYRFEFDFINYIYDTYKLDPPVINPDSIQEILTNLSPIQRMKYIPSLVPVIDIQNFMAEVRDKGLISTLKERIQEYQSEIQKNYPHKSFSEFTLVRYESIWSYPFDELIWIPYTNGIHVFAKEDLLNQNRNPYTREELPKWIPEGKSISFLDAWTDSLKSIIQI